MSSDYNQYTYENYSTDLNTQPYKRKFDSEKSEIPKMITSFIPTSLKTKSLNQTYSTPTPINSQFETYKNMRFEEVNIIPTSSVSYDSFPVIPDEYDVRNPNIYDISKQEILKEINEEKNRKFMEEQKEMERERRRKEKLEEEKAIEDLKRNPFSREAKDTLLNGRGRGRGREMTLPAWMMKDLSENVFINNNKNSQIENNLKISKDTSPTPTCVLLIRNMVPLNMVDINLKVYIYIYIYSMILKENVMNLEE